jgi:transposase InsO family protein
MDYTQRRPGLNDLPGQYPRRWNAELSDSKKTIPREIYIDNGKQFVSKVFKAGVQKHGIKLIFGRPYNPRRRGKIERYHKTLYQELITLKEFRSLSHFKRELCTFDH